MLLRTVIYVSDALSVCFEMMYRAGVQTVSQLLSSEWSSHIGSWHNRTVGEQPFSWGRMFSSYWSGAVLNHILHSLSVLKVHPWSTSQTASVWSHILGVWCILFDKLALEGWSSRFPLSKPQIINISLLWPCVSVTLSVALLGNLTYLIGNDTAKWL